MILGFRYNMPGQLINLNTMAAVFTIGFKWVVEYSGHVEFKFLIECSIRNACLIKSLR
jgi:hypothetical protein